VRAPLLAGLRARIARIERHPPVQASIAQTSIALRRAAAPAARSGAWTLGAPEVDGRLSGGLDPRSLHEIKPEAFQTGLAAGAWAASLGFALRLAARRLRALEGRPQLLWCWPSALAREIGLPYGPGLSFLGLEPSSCLFVETQRASEALWAMEEGLKSKAVALVIGVLQEARLTPARRLSLAAGAQGTPCLIVTDGRTSAAGATATRWRVGARASAIHPFETSATGALRYAVSLERCREGSLAAQVSPQLLEWSHATHRFRLASVLAHRATRPRGERRRSG
jgi:protein ImuA